MADKMVDITERQDELTVRYRIAQNSPNNVGFLDMSLFVMTPELNGLKIPLWGMGTYWAIVRTPETFCTDKEERNRMERFMESFGKSKDSIRKIHTLIIFPNEYAFLVWYAELSEEIKKEFEIVLDSAWFENGRSSKMKYQLDEEYRQFKVNNLVPVAERDASSGSHQGQVS